jgi:hypothetical protein
MSRITKPTFSHQNTNKQTHEEIMEKLCELLHRLELSPNTGLSASYQREAFFGSNVVGEIEAIALRVFHRERENEQKTRPLEQQVDGLDKDTREKINAYALISSKPYLSRKEAALYLGVSERSIAEWAARPPDQNPFPESHAGGEPRVKRQSIDEWAARENMRRRLKAAG